MSSGKYWKLIKFRFGGKFEKSYLNLYNSQINERSLTFGLGLPLRKTKSEINKYDVKLENQKNEYEAYIIPKQLLLTFFLYYKIF